MFKLNSFQLGVFRLRMSALILGFCQQDIRLRNLPRAILIGRQIEDLLIG